MIELSKQIEEYRVAKNSYITETGSIDAFGLYCLLQGEADVFVELNEKKNLIGKLKVIY